MLSLSPLLPVFLLFLSAIPSALSLPSPLLLSGAYDVTWDSPGKEPGLNTANQPTYYSGLPLGNGDVTVYVWPNVSASPSLPLFSNNGSAYGEVSMYVSKADAMASDTALFKLAKVTLRISPNPFKDCTETSCTTGFLQALRLSTSSVRIAAGGVNVTVFVDALRNAVRLRAQSTTSQPLTSVDLLVESYDNSFLCNSSFSPPDVYMDSSSLGSLSASAVGLSHRNPSDGSSNTDYFNKTLVQQGLGRLLDQVQHVDVWTGRQFGLLASAQPASLLRRVGNTTLSSTQAASSFDFVLSALTNRTSSSQLWEAQVLSAHVQALAVSYDDAWSAHVASWQAFWNRSHIDVGGAQGSGADDGLTISAQYARTRYLQAIQAGTQWPIKFNGQLFVANMGPVTTSSGPDFRQWGTSSWWQNTRLPYYNMIPAGDFEQMRTIFDFYMSFLDLAQLRTQTYFNHSGIFFTETKTLFGLFAPGDYGCDRSPGSPGSLPVYLEENEYIHYDYAGNAGGPEVALMLLDYYRYTGDEAALKQYLPLLVDTLEFFRQHYQVVDGKVRFFPAQVLETYWCAYPPTEENCCVNDLPTVAAMQVLTRRALTLPTGIIPQDTLEKWQAFAQMLPDLPVAQNYLQSAEKLSPGTHNSETPEMYAVHPWQIYSVGARVGGLQPDLTPALNSLAKRGAHGSGWNQGIMNAALLGDADLAFGSVLGRAKTNPAAGYRFPAFAPHEQDYEPSADHYANMNSALNWMLVQDAQDVNATIVLFPGWPCARDVNFTLAAPQATTVTVVYVNQKLESLTVSPPSAGRRIKFANCVSSEHAQALLL